MRIMAHHHHNHCSRLHSRVSNSGRKQYFVEQIAFLSSTTRRSSGTTIQQEIDKEASPAPAGTSSTATAAKTTFQVATWNVWIGQNGDGNPHPGPRMSALCRILQEHHSDEWPLWFVVSSFCHQMYIKYIFFIYTIRLTLIVRNRDLYVRQPTTAVSTYTTSRTQAKYLDSMPFRALIRLT